MEVREREWEIPRAGVDAPDDGPGVDGALRRGKVAKDAEVDDDDAILGRSQREQLP